MLEYVWNVISSLILRKSPRPDEFNDQFFKSSSDIIGQEVFHLNQTFFKGKLNTETITKIILVPMPTCISAEEIFVLRPTSLCNEIYKIIAKILVARVKSVLIKCSSSKQSIFIEDM